MDLEYDASAFTVGSIAHAKKIILTPEGGSTEARWREETAWVLDLLLKRWPLDASSCVLDYGCGVGRIAKELIERTGCFVVGVDISSSMRALSHAYVDSPRFLSCAPEALEEFVCPFDYGLAIWSLQHCERPSEDIERLAAELDVAGTELFLLNNTTRAVPTTKGWQDDGLDIEAMLKPSFEGALDGLIPASAAPHHVRAGCRWGFFSRASAP